LYGTLADPPKFPLKRGTLIDLLSLKRGVRGQYFSVKPKIYNYVGWVDDRKPDIDKGLLGFTLFNPTYENS
jgi:hypothetical protein